MVLTQKLIYGHSDSKRGGGLSSTDVVAGDVVNILDEAQPPILGKIKLVSQHKNDVAEISPVVLLDENGEKIPSLLPRIKFGESEHAVRQKIAKSDLEDGTIAKFRTEIEEIKEQEGITFVQLEALGLKFEQAWTTTAYGDYSKESVLVPNDLMQQQKGSDVLWAKTGIYFGGIRFVKKIGEYSIFISKSSTSRRMGTSRGNVLIVINGNSEIMIRQLSNFGGGILDLTKSESDIYDVLGNIVARESSKTYNLGRDGEHYTQKDFLKLVVDSEGKLIGDFKPYEAELYFSSEPQGD